MRSQIQGSPLPDGWQAGFRVIFLFVHRTQTGLLSSLLICRQVLDLPAIALALAASLCLAGGLAQARRGGLPARALTSICFFNYALNSPNNLLFPYIVRSRMAGG